MSGTAGANPGQHAGEDCLAVRVVEDPNDDGHQGGCPQRIARRVVDGASQPAVPLGSGSFRRRSAQGLGVSGDSVPVFGAGEGFRCGWPGAADGDLGGTDIVEESLGRGRPTQTLDLLLGHGTRGRGQPQLSVHHRLGRAFAGGGRMVQPLGACLVPTGTGPMEALRRVEAATR
ncbi:hypothetical protein ACF1BB_04355 [Streptomyces griseoluteus]|uniref:hypothetical protein n=1 Tax=Streptomyces griseoluteus TaxID=29306 RepID=UPI0036FAC65D